MLNKEIEKYLQESFFFDWKHPIVQEKIKEFIQDQETDLDKVLAIYYKVRDGFRYNPYNIYVEPIAFKSSEIFQRKEGHCIDKSIALISCCRAIGIPARIGLAKVQNHIGTEKLEEKLGTNILVPHGYTEVYLNNIWVKATPAFNKQLCKKLNVRPLNFNGIEDSIFQEFNQKGGNFMEYLEDYGTFEDLPLEFILDSIQTHYPNWNVKIS